MWRMLQQPEPSDYVVGTGIAHSVRELVQRAFEHVSLDWEKHVRVDQALVRPAEVDVLIANGEKARSQLGWEPSVSFEGLIDMMVDADLERLEGKG
jgi:GDPmannose 4,6-dehydratase